MFKHAIVIFGILALRPFVFLASQVDPPATRTPSQDALVVELLPERGEMAEDPGGDLYRRALEDIAESEDGQRAVARELAAIRADRRQRRGQRGPVRRRRQSHRVLLQW